MQYNYRPVKIQLEANEDLIALVAATIETAGRNSMAEIVSELRYELMCGLREGIKLGQEILAILVTRKHAQAIALAKTTHLILF